MKNTIALVSSPEFWQFLRFSILGGIGGSFTAWLLGLPWFLKDSILNGKINLFQAFGLTVLISVVLSVMTAITVSFLLRNDQAKETA
jgi:hypothetical protein